MPVVFIQTVKFVMHCWELKLHFYFYYRKAPFQIKTKTLADSLSKKFSVILFEQLGTGRTVANSDKYDPGISDSRTYVNCLLDHLDIEASHLFRHSTGCELGVSGLDLNPARVKHSLY